MNIKKLHPDIGDEAREIDIGNEGRPYDGPRYQKSAFERSGVDFSRRELFLRTGRRVFVDIFLALDMVSSAVSQDRKHPSVLLFTNISNTGETGAFDDSEEMFDHHQTLLPGSVFGFCPVFVGGSKTKWQYPLRKLFSGLPVAAQ